MKPCIHARKANRIFAQLQDTALMPYAPRHAILPSSIHRDYLLCFLAVFLRGPLEIFIVPSFAVPRYSSIIEHYGEDAGATSA